MGTQAALEGCARGVSGLLAVAVLVLAAAAAEVGIVHKYATVSVESHVVTVNGHRHRYVERRRHEARRVGRVLSNDDVSTARTFLIALRRRGLDHH
jgi:hypothetical protein